MFKKMHWNTIVSLSIIALVVVVTLAHLFNKDTNIGCAFAQSHFLWKVAGFGLYGVAGWRIYRQWGKESTWQFNLTLFLLLCLATASILGFNYGYNCL